MSSFSPICCPNILKTPHWYPFEKAAVRRGPWKKSLLIENKKNEKKRGKGMTLFKMWQKQMKQKAKNGRKKTRFWKYKRKRKKQETRLPIFKMQQMQMKKDAKKKRKKSFLRVKKIRKRGCRFSKCNQHLRPLLLLHAIKELQSQQKHRNATLFFHKHQHART